MPVYLVHGFRWPRDGFTGVRVHTITNNLDGCSSEYIQNADSREELLKSFRWAYPEIMKHLEGPGRTLEFIEQYDPTDESCEKISQPFAFVGDRVVMIAGGAMAAEAARRQMGVNQPQKQGQNKTPSTNQSEGQDNETKAPSGKRKPDSAGKGSVSSLNSPTSVTSLSMNVEEVIAQGPGLSTQAWEALADLRDKIAEGEKIGWWIVYNGDPVRSFTPYSDDEDDFDSTIGEDDEGEQTETEDDRRRLKPQISKTGIGPPPPMPVEPPTPTVVRKKSMPMRDKELPPPPVGSDQTALPNKFPSEGSPPKPQIRSAGSAKFPQTFIHRSSKASPANNTPHLTEKANAKHEPGVNTRPEAELVIPEPSKLKEMAKSQGLRKKFFGKRP